MYDREYLSWLSSGRGRIKRARVGNNPTVMEESIFWIIAVAALVSGFFWLFVFYLFSVFSRRRKKKKAPCRELKFTLPDRENTFVRARLSTVLNREFLEAERQEEKLAIEFSQALKMLDKICASPLSTAERIEVGQMQDALHTFEVKERFSAKEVSSINEKFARLLKLSAKYNV